MFLQPQINSSENVSRSEAEIVTLIPVINIFLDHKVNSKYPNFQFLRVRLIYEFRTNTDLEQIFCSAQMF